MEKNNSGLIRIILISVFAYVVTSLVARPTFSADIKEEALFFAKLFIVTILCLLCYSVQGEDAGIFGHLAMGGLVVLTLAYFYTIYTHMNRLTLQTFERKDVFKNILPAAGVVIVILVITYFVVHVFPSNGNGFTHKFDK